MMFFLSFFYEGTTDREKKEKKKEMREGRRRENMRSFRSCHEHQDVMMEEWRVNKEDSL